MRRRVSKRTLYVHRQKMPAILADACEKLRACVYNPKILPEIWRLPGRVKNTYLPALIAMIESMCAILMCTDVVMLCVGYPEGDGFRCRSNAQLLKRTNLILRRFQRGMERWKILHFLGFKSRADIKKERKHGFAAWRWVTEYLFHRLKMHDELVTARQEASEERRGLRATEALAREGVVNAPQTDEERAAAARERGMRLNAELFAKVRGNDTS